MRVASLAVLFGAVWALQAQDFIRVSTSAPRYLEDTNGRPYIPIGPNVGWERFATGEDEVFRLTESRFRLIAANRGNFARVYLSHPFYELNPDADPAEVEKKLRRVDRLISLARKHGLRLKLCLEHFRSFEPEKPGFPGSISFGRPANGALFPDMAAFFASPEGKAIYLRKLDLLSKRYSNEPAILGWELWNEINAVKGSGWTEWTQAMLPELKRRFPRHLSLQSLGSFDNERAAGIYRTFSRMPGNEMAQVHRYLDPGAALDVCRGPMDVLTADAVRTIRSYSSDRPVVISEVGAVEAHHAGPSKLYENDREGILLHDGLFAGFFAGGAGPGQFWHWQDYIEKHNLWFHFDRFAESVKGIDPRQEDFEPRFIEQPRLRVYLLSGRKHDLLWIRDASTDWRSELQQGVAAPTLTGLRVAVRGKSADVYDPWKSRHSAGRIEKGDLILPPFRRSLVVRVTAP